MGVCGRASAKYFVHHLHIRFYFAPVNIMVSGNHKDGSSVAASGSRELVKPSLGRLVLDFFSRERNVTNDDQVRGRTNRLAHDLRVRKQIGADTLVLDIISSALLPEVDV
jgi:hypothetical protein